MSRLIDTDAVEGGTIYFIGENNKIHDVTGEAIAYLIDRHLGYKLRPTIYFTKEEAEAKLAELKGVQIDN